MSFNMYFSILTSWLITEINILRCMIRKMAKFVCDVKANPKSPSPHLSEDELQKKISCYIEVTNVLQAYVYRALTSASLHLADDGSLFLWFGTVWSLVLF